MFYIRFFQTKTPIRSWVWHMFLIPALGSLRQEDYSKLETSPGCISQTLSGKQKRNPNIAIKINLLYHECPSIMSSFVFLPSLPSPLSFPRAFEPGEYRTNSSRWNLLSLQTMSNNNNKNRANQTQTHWAGPERPGQVGEGGSKVVLHRGNRPLCVSYRQFGIPVP